MIRSTFALMVAALVWTAPLRHPAAHADEPAVLSKPPRLIRFVQAEPPPALAERKHAEVELEIDVDATGKVTSARVTKPAGDGFDESALGAARQFVFEPGEAGGKPVPVRVTYRYRFVEAARPSPAPAAAPTPAPATTELAGRVLRMGDRTPLAGVSVYVDDGAESATTDGDGRFRLAAPAGSHQLRFRGPDIAATDATIALEPSRPRQVTFYVAERERYQSTVRARRAVVETVEQTLQAEEFRRIPGTQGDTLKAVQNLPGVARSPFGGGLLVVWGSAPFDTRVYVDGVFIPTLYHFGGLRSTVNGEMVQQLTFLPGGYGVDYGRGLGGVIEIESRRPRTNGYHGFVQLDLIDGSLSVEGPITKNLSFAVAARRSWIDAFLPLFTTNDFQLSPRYWDYQGRLHWRVSARDDIDFFLFGSDDSLNLIAKNPDPGLSAQFDSHIYYHRALARYSHRFGKGATLSVTPSVGYDVPFQVQAMIGNLPFNVDAATFEYNLRAVARLPLFSWLRADAGLDFEGNRYRIDASTPTRGAPREGDTPGPIGGTAFARSHLLLYLNNTAPYLALVLTPLKRLTLTPQLRLEVFSFSGSGAASAGLLGTQPYSFTHAYARVEPRVSARYQLLPKLALKGAFGLYHQAPDPGSFLLPSGNPSVKPELALHYVFGVDIQATPTLHIELQGFYKDLRDLVVRGEHPGDPALVSEGIGRVYGGELLVRQQLWKNFFGWIAYTLSKSERRDHPDAPWRRFQYDQTHILTLIGSYKFGRGYQVGLRFRYVTGNPYTPVVGAYYDVNQDNYVPLRGPTYSGRLGAFHQLDVRFDKTWTYRQFRFSLYVDVQNLYNASVPEAITYNFDYTKSKEVSGLPFLPVLGIRGDF